MAGEEAAVLIEFECERDTAGHFGLPGRHRDR
jgi:hypothetical protein